MFTFSGKPWKTGTASSPRDPHFVSKDAEQDANDVAGNV